MGNRELNAVTIARRSKDYSSIEFIVWCTVFGCVLEIRWVACGIKSFHFVLLPQGRLSDLLRDCVRFCESVAKLAR